VGHPPEVGSLLLVRHYPQRLGLVKIVDEAVPQRGRAQLTYGEVVAALIANRLSAPAPLPQAATLPSSGASAGVGERRSTASERLIDASGWMSGA
jgi:Domain of unknown function (DUF4277)